VTPEQRRRGLLAGARLLLPGLLLAGPGQWLLRRWDLPLWPAALPGFVLLFGSACLVYLAISGR
jgi:hypothetical protein